jgi:hypothetical protein
LSGTSFESFGLWIDFNVQSPYSCAAIGGLFSVVTTVVDSRFSEALSPEHLSSVHGANAVR